MLGAKKDITLLCWANMLAINGDILSLEFFELPARIELKPREPGSITFPAKVESVVAGFNAVNTPEPADD